MEEVLFRSQVAFGGGDGGVAEQQPNLFQLPSREAAEFGGAGRGPGWRSRAGRRNPARKTNTACRVSDAPVIWPCRFIERSRCPSQITAAPIQSSTANFTQAGRRPRQGLCAGGRA